MINHLRLLFDSLVEIFIVPIKEGLPRPRTWPVGLGPVMLVVGFGYLIGVGLVLGAGLLRSIETQIIFDGFMVMGMGSLTILTWLVSLTLATGLTAALHVRPDLRLVAVALLLSPMLPLLTYAPGPVALALLGILIMVAIRWRGRFAAWEFPVLWLLVCLGFLLPLRWEVNYGYDQRTALVTLTLTVMNALAIPALLMAGYTAAQLSTSLSQWLGYRATEAMPRRVMIVIALVLATANLGWSLWESITDQLSWGWRSWLGSALLVALAAALILGLRAGLPVRGRSRQDPAEPDELDTSFQPLAYGFAALMLAPMILSVVGAFGTALVTVTLGHSPQWLTWLGSGSVAVAAVRLGIAALACWVGWRRARRGQRVSIVVLAAYAAIMAYSAGPLLFEAWLGWDPELVGALLLVGMLAVWAVNREAGGEHQLLVVALLVSLYRFREVLSDPAAVFVGVSAATVLLFSLLWRALTDGNLARGDSRALPLASRVLGYATMMLLGVLTLAVVAQIRATDTPLDQTTMIEFGDRTLGGALFLAAGLAALGAFYRAGTLSRR